jgi:hypothetical protein
MKDIEYQAPAGADLPDDYCITIVTDDVPLGKRIHADGTKSSNVMLVDGEAYTVRCRTHEELAQVIQYASERNTTALILGHFGVPVGVEFRLVSRGLMRGALMTIQGVTDPAAISDEELDGIHVLTDPLGQTNIAVCRTKHNARPSRWALIDRDIDAQTPATFASLSHEAFLRALDDVIPGISAATRVSTLSSSARVTEYGGKPGSKAGHTFVRLDHPVDRDQLKAAVRARALATGKAWLVNKYAKDDPTRAVAQDWRCLLDDSVLALERLVFCGAPTVDHGSGLIVHPQTVEIHRGTTDDVCADLELPDEDDLVTVTTAAGRPVLMERDGEGGVAQFREDGLRPTTPIETRDGMMTLAQVAATLQPGLKVRCQAPFRESSSWAAFVGLTQRGEPFVYDSGTNTTYNLVHEPDPAIARLIAGTAKRQAAALGVTLPDPTPLPEHELPPEARPTWFTQAVAPSVLPPAAVDAIERNTNRAAEQAQPLGRAVKIPQKVLDDMPLQLRTAYDWMMATQPTEPQSELALAASLALAATVLGRMVRTGTGLRTNLYIVATAATGTGKEHGRKCIRRALASANLAHLEGGDPASGPAIVSRIAEHPSTLLQLDEFGLLLQSAKRENSPKHGIIKELLALTGAAEQTYVGTMYSDTKAKAARAIVYPCLNVYATTTADTLYEALNGADMASGFLNRLMLLESPAQSRASLGLRYSDAGAGVPVGLTHWMAAVHSSAPIVPGTGNLVGRTPEHAPTVRLTAPAMHIAESIVQPWLDGAVEVAKRKGMVDLWTRFGALLQRLALVHACTSHTAEEYIAARDSERGLEIGPSSITWAFGLAKHCMLRMEDVLTSNLSGSDHEALMNKIKEFLRRPYGVKRKTQTFGGAIGFPKSMIISSIRQARAAKPLDLNNALSSLIDSGEIIEIDVRGPSVRSRAFVHAEHYSSTMDPETLVAHIDGHPDHSYEQITESIITATRVRSN